ncbi:hypothetical protein N7468_005106 [Penicillium chermesinum]|uniref:Uncharacterized protein n=1 Tax=Penicillium chermesinum TaxID=63820 RepID=A0A9W9TMP5_9EURO|nr:uncharacterized protein N7468_005106 [Penicillium chermesinum]KAJ5232150.1 hypothetical protein N7468_005106 [Penicillium chermesinum]
MCDHKKLKLEGISLGPAKLELKFKANMNPRFLLLCYKRTDQTYQLQNAPGLPLEKHSDLRPRFGSKLNGKLLAQLTQDMQTSCFKH